MQNLPTLLDYNTFRLHENKNIIFKDRDMQENSKLEIVVFAANIGGAPTFAKVLTFLLHEVSFESKQKSICVASALLNFARFQNHGSSRKFWLSFRISVRVYDFFLTVLRNVVGPVLVI